MAYIEKRLHPTGKVTYRARVRIHGMPQESASFPTRTAAKEWVRLKENELLQNRYFPHTPTKKTLAHLLEHYIQNELPKKPKSYLKQKQLLTFWKHKLGDYYLTHISPSLIAQVRDQLLAETTYRGDLRSPATVNRYLAALSKVFTITIKEYGWLKENPVLFIQRPSEPKGRERYLTLEEINRLLDACRYCRSTHLYPIVVFALATGARRGEILNLNWSDIDFEQHIAHFRHTKNGETRTIALSQHLIDILVTERKRRVVISPYVFPSKDGTHPADITTAWTQTIQKAGFKNLRFHDLRHTAASHMAMNGASTLEIAAVLGHKTLAMVKRYSHLSNSATAKVLKRMNEAIFGAA